MKILFCDIVNPMIPNYDNYKNALAIKIENGRLIILFFNEHKDEKNEPTGAVYSIGLNSEYGKKYEGEWEAGFGTIFENFEDDVWWILLFDSEDEAHAFAWVIERFYNNVALPEFMAMMSRRE